MSGTGTVPRLVIPSPAVGLLLFPCLVEFPDGSTRSPCKVYFAPGGCDVWEWNQTAGRAEIVASGPVLKDDRTGVYRLDVPEIGEIRIVVDPTDCGCSHPLKRFRPAAPVRL